MICASIIVYAVYFLLTRKLRVVKSGDRLWTAGPSDCDLLSFAEVFHFILYITRKGGGKHT